MKYRTDLVQPTRAHRTGRKLVDGRASSVTVHNTGNPGATAANHAAYLKNADRNASWHITVDDIEAVLHIPLDEQAWHSGTSAGNTTSIGIEVCEFNDASRQAKADANAVQLIAGLLKGDPWSGVGHLDPSHVRTHQSWSGKACPRKLLPVWNDFVKRIRDAYSPKEVAVEGYIWFVVNMTRDDAAELIRQAKGVGSKAQYTIDSPPGTTTCLIHIDRKTYPRLERFCTNRDRKPQYWAALGTPSVVKR